LKEKIIIESFQGNYEVEFCENLEKVDLFSRSGYVEYFILADKKVWELYNMHSRKLKDFPVYLVEVNEEAKSLIGVNNFSNWLIANGATKSAIILAIGGGVVQDIATFTAHIYKRGIKWEYLPTTLLSQADSCIGAKCGINVMPYKNQIGVLHSPSKVWVVSEFLKTLDDKTFESGYGEILKLSLTPPHSFYLELQKELNDNGIVRNHALRWIYLSLRAKQAIIEADEYEKDHRRILNYGHSFGHALEGVSGNSVNHGSGVLFGIDLINYLSVQWGVLDKRVFQDIRNTITSNFSLDFLPKELKALSLVNALKTDKKVVSGLMNFVVINNAMELVITPKPIDKHLLNLVERYIADDCIFSSS
jgi:3-dehydroquinate synthase